MRPSLPVPGIAAGSIWFSVTIRWTDGARGVDAATAATGAGAAAGAGLTGAGAGAGAGSAALAEAASLAGDGAAAAAAGLAAGLAPAPPILPRTVPGTTVAPSSASISVRTPSSEATTSRLTLSVSSSTSSSSLTTGSPAFLVQRATVASVTDSPSAGVIMSVMERRLLEVTSLSRSGGSYAHFQSQANAPAGRRPDFRRRLGRGRSVAPSCDGSSGPRRWRPRPDGRHSGRAWR